jgi:hypothetical protein
MARWSDRPVGPTKNNKKKKKKKVYIRSVISLKRIIFLKKVFKKVKNTYTGLGDLVP